jgi:hypothetical protein
MHITPIDTTSQTRTEVVVALSSNCLSPARFEARFLGIAFIPVEAHSGPTVACFRFAIARSYVLEPFFANTVHLANSGPVGNHHLFREDTTYSPI